MLTVCKRKNRVKQVVQGVGCWQKNPVSSKNGSAPPLPSSDIQRSNHLLQRFELGLSEQAVFPEPVIKLLQRGWRLSDAPQPGCCCALTAQRWVVLSCTGLKSAATLRLDLMLAERLRPAAGALRPAASQLAASVAAVDASYGFSKKGSREGMAGRKPPRSLRPLCSP